MAFSVIKVGNKDRPATSENIEEIRRIARAVKNDAELSIVTHHAIKIIRVNPGQGETVVYKIGSKEHPADDNDIADLQKELAEAKAEKRPVVTHHLVSIDYITVK